MPNKHKRAVDSAKRISLRQNRATPLDYCEAIFLARPNQVEQYIATAIEHLIASPNIEKDAQAIAAAYFHELPHYNVDVDPEQVDGTAPAAAPAPGNPGEDRGYAMRSYPEDVLQSGRDDGRRSLDELTWAGEVLIGAVLRAGELRAFAVATAKAIRLFCSYRLLGRGAKTAALHVDSIACKLERAAKAAGTLTDPLNPRRRPEAELRAVDAAMRRGASTEEVNAIVRFGAEFDALRRHGYEPASSREGFIATNMRRMHFEHGNRRNNNRNNNRNR